MTQDPDYVFVYGTLREDPDHEMYRVLARSSRFVGDGTVNARLYDLGQYPGIVLSPDPTDLVFGELYELRPELAVSALRELDDYEGLGPTDPLPHEYRREIVPVRIEGGATIPAWAYVLASPVPSHPQIPSSDYLSWKQRRRNT